MYRIKTNRGDTFESYNTNILEALQHQGIYLNASCGGKGSCGRCKIRVLEGKVNSISFSRISRKERESGYVLACQSYPASDLFIELPEKLIEVSEKISKAKIELINKVFFENPKILKPLVEKISLELKPPSIEDSVADFDRLKNNLGISLYIERGLASSISEYFRENKWQISLAKAEGEIIRFTTHEEKIYAVAVDIGTTTIALALIDMETAKIVDIATCYNSQIVYGDDVITRIIYSIEKEKGLEILRNSVVNDINALIKTVESRNRDGRISYVVLSGNTTMCHIFWGIPPKYIREEPYVPTFNHYPIWKASDAKLLLDRNIPVYTLPSVAGYVGGDIVAGVIASGMYKESALSLFIDIGTNGEIVIGNRDWLITASTSAGPCFEGSGISCGMRAIEGAIESFNFNKEKDTFQLGIIGNRSPLGICGSGMIDIVSELFSEGILDHKGKLLPDSSRYIKHVDEEFRFVFDDACYITQSDIDNIVRAKGAIYAGIYTVLEEVGVKEKDIEKVYLAGGFGEFLDIKKAIKIGMLPNIPIERFILLGNASLTGAILCVLSREIKRLADEVADIMTYIDLSGSKRFTEEYLSSLFLPHTDLERFKNSY